jgi:hypothetical protein
MDQQRQEAGAEKWVFPDSLAARRDRISADIVQKSITLQQIHGTAYAVAFLKEKNIDMDIAMRVLLSRPAYRRRDDLIDHLAVQAAITNPDV